MSATTAYERLLDALRDHGSDVKETGQGKAVAQCPAHDDRNPSLSITKTAGRTLLYCHGGCPTVDVLATLNKTMADLYDEPYRDRRYGDVYAKYQYPGGRVVLRTADKQFPQPGNNKDRSLYHADRISDAKKVYVVEGEEDVHAVEAHGGVAVCPPMGAGKQPNRFDWPLNGLDVTIVADKDSNGQGHKHAAQVAEHLRGTAASVRIVEAAVGKDASEHLAAGKTLEELVAVDDVPSVLDRMFNGAWLDAQEFEPLEYAVDGIITEGFGLLVGPPKQGKSWLVNDIGLAVAAGGKALGRIAVKRKPVLYLALEDGERRLQSRARRVLGDGQPIPAGIHFITKATPMEAIQAITEFMARHADEKPLVILDTLGKVKPSKRPGEDSYQVDYAIGTTLKDAVDAVPGATLLVVHHTRKAMSADFVDSVSGTNAIAGSADFVMVLSRKRHSDDAVLAVTGRDIPEAEYALHADQKVLWRLDGDDLAAAAKTVGRRREDEQLARLSEHGLKVLAYVNSRSEVTTTPADVAKKFSMDNKAAGQYLARLAKLERIGKEGRGAYRSLLQGGEESEESEESAGQGSISFLHQHSLSEESEENTGQALLEVGEKKGEPEQPIPHFLHPPLSSEGKETAADQPIPHFLQIPHHDDGRDRDAANAAYIQGLCTECHTRPYRPGGTKCEECFQSENGFKR